jgi:hypothetical protein
VQKPGPCESASGPRPGPARGVALAGFRRCGPLVHEVRRLCTHFLPGMTKMLPDPAVEGQGK